MHFASGNGAKSYFSGSRALHGLRQNPTQSRLHQRQFLTPDRPATLDVQGSFNLLDDLRDRCYPLADSGRPGSLSLSQRGLG